MCVAAARELGQRARGRARRPGRSVKFGCSPSVGARERVAVEVVEGDDLVVVDEPPRERRADEAGAAGDQDPLAAQRHAASLAARYASTRDAHRRRRRACWRAVVGCGVVLRARLDAASRSTSTITVWPDGCGASEPPGAGRCACAPADGTVPQALDRLHAGCSSWREPFAPTPQDASAPRSPAGRSGARERPDRRPAVWVRLTGSTAARSSAGAACLAAPAAAPDGSPRVARPPTRGARPATVGRRPAAGRRADVSGDRARVTDRALA